MGELDTDGDGQISKAEFHTWYIQSEAYIQKDIRTVFDRFDEDNSGTIDKNEVRKLLKSLGEKGCPTEKDINEVRGAISRTLRARAEGC